MTPELLTADALTAGAEYDLGHHLLTQESIVAFAREWDPQPFHTDEEWAHSHYFGGVVASGAQLLAVAQRLCVLAVYSGWRVYAGRSLDGIRFLRPVRGGASLNGHLRVVSVEPTHPERSLVTHTVVLRDGDAPVFEMTCQLYVYR